MSRKALVVVDYNNDFVHSDGALTCGLAGQRLDPFIARQIRLFHGRGDAVVIVNDQHQPDDEEFAIWPVHCVQGTWGSQPYGETAEVIGQLRGKPGFYELPKTKYDAFYETDLDAVLRKEGVREVYVAGVCTSICVSATVQGGYFRGYRMKVFQDGVADLTEEAHHFMLRHMENIYKAEVV
jgi:nicotinamidase-related amidase